MAKNLHVVKLTDLEVIALASAEPKATEEGSIFGKLLSNAFNSAKDQLESIAQAKILNNGDSVSAPSDEFDNPELQTEAVTTNGSDSALPVEAEKETAKAGKKGKFEPSID